MNDYYSVSASLKHIPHTVHEPYNSTCDARGEKVEALYSAISGSLAFFSRAYHQFLSPVPLNV